MNELRIEKVVNITENPNDMYCVVCSNMSYPECRKDCIKEGKYTKYTEKKEGIQWK